MFACSLSPSSFVSLLSLFPSVASLPSVTRNIVTVTYYLLLVVYSSALFFQPGYRYRNHLYNKIFHVVFPSIGIGAVVANDNKALLLTSTIFYSLASLVSFIAFCYMLIATCAVCVMWDFEPEDEEDGLGVYCCLSLCPPTCLVSLVLAMEVTAAVCSGLLYKQ